MPWWIPESVWAERSTMDKQAASPGKLVFRRFLRNKLAIIGVAVLILMFLFSFVGPFLYPYGQTEVFSTYRTMNSEYASAKERTEYVTYPLTGEVLPIQPKEDLEVYLEEDRLMVAEKLSEGLYAIGDGRLENLEQIGIYNSKIGAVSGQSPELSAAVAAALRQGNRIVSFEQEIYALAPGDVPIETKVYRGTPVMPETPMAVASLWHVEGAFSPQEQGRLLYENAEHLEEIAARLVIRDRSGGDTLSEDFKKQLKTAIETMEGNSAQFSYPLPSLDDSGSLVDTEITVTRKPLEYAVSCTQRVYVIDRYGEPSAAHPLGTDGDGMDVLARMMAGGRVSLLVGFVVVLLEVLLGMVLGGLAGYFGGWVDHGIMRLVDVFYCIPSLPVLIILGAMFDAVRMAPYVRLFWLMAILGFLGWASIARLVRGQILSLREQEFMVAAEAAGLPASRRIFRHLLPNVMPQLIVTATMGLGSVILTESTLSFLGLGVKHPMATWGTMINSVTRSTETMIRYTHIWLPVGLLICLTVIAFNFAGDGLRDALDPKMKR